MTGVEMTDMRQRKLTFALVALMLILAGCKAESPTAPPVTPGPTPGGGVTPPRVLERVEPQYSQEARKARYQGTVVLEVIVRKDGTVDIMRIVRSLGFGLDENAIQALKQWRFKPGMRNGVPVDVALNVEVNFNLR